VVTQLNPELTLTAVGGETRTIGEWTTTFQLLTVIIDPYTQESAWLLETAGRFLEHFREAAVRCTWTVTADEEDAKRFLGPWADRFLVHCDADRSFVKELGIERTPAVGYIRQDRAIIATTEGWNPREWEQLGALVGQVTSWSVPKLPGPADPGDFEGAPAQG